MVAGSAENLGAGSAEMTEVKWVEMSVARTGLQLVAGSAEKLEVESVHTTEARWAQTLVVG